MKSSFEKRMNVLYILFFAYALLLLVKLSYVQIVKGEEYAQRIGRQSERRVVVTGMRGAILDRFGRTFARSVSQKVVVQRDDDTTRVIRTSRLYPHGSVGGQVLGYTGRDGNGLAGIEYKFDKSLKGKPGSLQRRKDGKNRQFKRVGDFSKDSLSGETIKLTLDLELQEIVEKVLAETVKKFEAKSAMAVVMNPQNGEIYALASVPNYDPSFGRPKGGKGQKLLPISYNYEPGSTFKVMTLAAAFEENLYHPKDSIDGKKGQFVIYDEIIRDHHPREMMSIEDALAYSSNVAFAQIGDSLGKRNLYRYVRDFGFGSKTDIRLPGEEKGIVHPVRNWSGRSVVTIPFGHEISTTLLQVVTAFSAIANGGYLVRPHIIHSQLDRYGNELYRAKRQVIRQVVSPETALHVRRMMRSVVTRGTARKVDFSPIELAGKTGTSEKINPETNHYDKEKVWASFVGMAPVDDPAIVIGVVVDEPKDAMAGGQVAAPAVAEILKSTIITPNMTLGGRLVGKQALSSQTMGERKKNTYPHVENFVRNEVVALCDSLKIPFEFVGNGEVIVNQSPEAGVMIVDETPLLLYTNKIIGDTNEEPLTVVPNCVGRTMKDALNALSIKGITPYFVGRGDVISQQPTAGTVLYVDMPCTLFCEVSQ